MLAPITAGAQSGRPDDNRGREVFIGGFTTRPAGERIDGGRERPDAARPESRDNSGSSDATAMLDDAFSALERGDVMLARRSLERIVHRYPDTLAAGAARRQLERLYGPPPGSDESTPRSEDGQHAQQDRLRSPDGRRPAPKQLPYDLVQLKLLMRDFQLTAGDRVFFGEAATELGLHARTVLSAQARWLSRHPDLPIYIDAHADDHGSRDRNFRLSQARGEVVRDRLVEEGVAFERVTIRAYGKDRPLAMCDLPGCAAQNRRVVTSIMPEAHSSNGHVPGTSFGSDGRGSGLGRIAGRE